MTSVATTLLITEPCPKLRVRWIAKTSRALVTCDSNPMGPITYAVELVPKVE